MKLIQKILSHGLLIAFFVAVFFLYLNRAELFPRWFGGSGDRAASVTGESQASAGEKVTRPKPEPVISKRPVVPPAAEETATEPQAGASSRDDGAAEPGAAVAGTEEDGSQAMSADAGTDAASGDAAQASAAETVETTDAPDGSGADQTGEAVTASPEPVIPAPAEEAPAASAQPAADAAQADAPPLAQELERARAFYWRKDIDAAASLYQSLNQAYPRNPDVWGETGNFYYSLQKSEQAADAYSHAFDLLVSQGDRQRARQLLDVIYRLDEEKAQALNARLQQSGD